MRGGWRGGARLPARNVDTAPPASTNSPPPLTMVFLAMPPDLLCMGLFCKKQFRVPPPRGAFMVREKAPMLGTTFRLDTSTGFGRLASTRYRALPLPLAGRWPRPLHDLPTSALAWGLKAG
jgi:hypothetical protein